MHQAIRSGVVVASVALLAGAASAQQSGPQPASPSIAFEDAPQAAQPDSYTLELSQPEAAAPTLSPAITAVAPEEAATPPTQEEIDAYYAEIEASLDRRTGVIPLSIAHVTLNVPDGYYFLDAEDAQTVLEDVWGNPPDSTVNGMLFPAGISATEDGSWGVVLTYEDTGYVSDEDASSIDYDMLIDAMRESSEADNRMRAAEGYPSIEIIGWAAQPRYDAATHKLYWAKELSFDQSPDHTLNYDMRVLGRHGVLSLNFVAGLEQLAEVERASPAVLAIPDFDQGFRYADFNPSTDAKSDLGLAGLIGGGAAAAVLAKNGGVIGAALLFLKKFGYLAFAAVAGAFALFRGLFNRKPKAEVKAEQRSATAFFDGPAAEDAPPPVEAEKPPGVV